MQPDNQPAPNPTWMTWTGWIISVLPALVLLASGVAKIVQPDGMDKAFKDLGWGMSLALGLGIVEIGCTILYLFPPTAILGAILLTAYLGGAVATHVRIGDMFLTQILFGAIVWLGLFFRDQRLRALVPWRGDATVPGTGGFVAALGKIVLTLGALVGVVAAFVVAHPAEYHVERSTTIDAPPSKVFEQVNDFHKWEPWNPWLKPDPEVKVTIEGASSGKGAIYKWSGNNKVGEGTMTLTESRPNELIRIKLEFAKPMEATADTEFRFKAEGEKTVVTWSMNGKNDLAGKAFSVVMGMEKMIGDRYAEGLANLKSVAEAK